MSIRNGHLLCLQRRLQTNIITNHPRIPMMAWDMMLVRN